jgi:retron-type reverse transcriptase
MAENEKARLYKEIVEQTSDEQLLERMRLLGFWPENQGLPQDPLAEVRERERLEEEMARLRRENAVVRDPEKALNEERKRRWEESKQRRADAKARRIAEEIRRRNAWNKRRAATLVHSGEGVSGGLEQRTSNVDALEELGLPVLHSGEDVAKAMGIALSSLRWLTYHRKSATLVHYHRYSVAKKTGGVRFISAPKPALKKAQRWIFEKILGWLETEPQAHGFVSDHSIVTNATSHVGKAVVINLDLKDFFPSITFRRVKGLFRKLGYSEHVATVFALLCTEPPRVAAELDGKVYHVALGARVLPQGACTSPAITNALCRRLDRRLAGLAKKHGFTYTRYADDLTFSGDNTKPVGRLLRSVRSIVTGEGLVEHPRKTRVMRRSNRQEVTGLTVNAKPAISRKEMRQLRAILHNAAKHGLESQNRDNRPNFAAYLRGRVEFACMVDPAKASALRVSLGKALAGQGT